MKIDKDFWSPGLCVLVCEKSEEAAADDGRRAEELALLALEIARRVPGSEAQRARLEGFDRTVEEAAMDLGANELQTFFRITLPLIAPGILSGALLAFTLSIDDYIVSSFVAGVGSTTLPLQIYSMVKTRVTPEINAVSTLLLIPTILLIVISDRLQRGSK